MELRLKKQYLNHSIGGGKLKEIRLNNIDPTLYQKYYDMGFTEFFEEIKPVKTKKKEDLDNDITE